MRKTLLLVVAFIFVSALAALATTVTISTNPGMFTSVVGANQAFFTGSAANSYSEGVFTFTGDFGVYNDTSSNHRAPTGDDTWYLSVPKDGSSTPKTFDVTFSTTGNNYFGLYWGSLDEYNTITLHTSGGNFTFGGAYLSSHFGVAIDCHTHNLCGDPTATKYFNFFVADGTINSVTLGSTNPALEADNFAVAQTPEPASLMLLGSGLLGLGGLLRRRK